MFALRVGGIIDRFGDMDNSAGVWEFFPPHGIDTMEVAEGKVNIDRYSLLNGLSNLITVSVYSASTVTIQSLEKSPLSKVHT
jgi:hypothetical protein